MNDILRQTESLSFLLCKCCIFLFCLSLLEVFPGICIYIDIYVYMYFMVQINCIYTTWKQKLCVLLYPCPTMDLVGIIRVYRYWTHGLSCPSVHPSVYGQVCWGRWYGLQNLAEHNFGLYWNFRTFQISYACSTYPMALSRNLSICGYQKSNLVFFTVTCWTAWFPFSIIIWWSEVNWSY